MLQALKDAIIRDGVGIGTEVVKVDSFLNHRIDVKLVRQMGEAFAEAFRDDRIDLVLTIEASGIGAAIATAQSLGDVPVVFAKKGKTRNTSGDVYTAEVYSFTHQVTNVIRVDRKYLTAGMRVLIIDDFMANGEAVQGLRSVLEQAGCVCAGVGVCIEKGFQPGGNRLRSEGVKYVPLAVVDAIDHGRIILRDE